MLIQGGLSSHEGSQHRTCLRTEQIITLKECHKGELTITVQVFIAKISQVRYNRKAKT